MNIKENKIQIKIFTLFVILILSAITLCNCYAIETTVNTNLSSLTLNQEGLTPNFDKSNLNYYIFLKNSINEIGINAIPEDSTSKVEIKGNKNLVTGDNKVEIVVTAKNNETKTYTINVTKTNDFVKSDSYLQTIILENIQLTPEFKPYIFEYNGGTVASDIDKILTFAAASQEGAKVEVLGNENLHEGENYITIKVTSEDTLTNKEYKIKITKLTNKKTEDLQRQSIENSIKDNSIATDNTSINNNFKMSNEKIIIIVLILIIIILLILLFKNKRKK